MDCKAYIVKIAIFSKVIFRFNAICQNSNCLLGRNWQGHLKIHMKNERSQKSQKNLEKIKIGGLTLPYLKTFYKTIVIKMMCQWFKARHRDQWNRNDSSEINPCIYNQSSKKFLIT